MGDFMPGAYGVEDRVFSGKFRKHLINSDGLSLAEQQRLTDRLTAHFGLDPVTCKRRGGAPSFESHADPNKHTIVFGSLAGTAVVAHEFAHILVGSPKKGEGDGYWHGPTWQSCYVACVSILLGDYHAQRLVSAFARFEADKIANKAKGARTAAKKRTTQKAGPRKRTVPVVHGAIHSKAMGKGVYLTWGARQERLITVRYGSRAGWYWVVSGYERDDLDFGASAEVWASLAKGEEFVLDGKRIIPLFTERQFSTKADALEWAVAWAQQR
jgi:hypothetical protein